MSQGEGTTSGPTDSYSRLLPEKDHFTSTEENINGSLMERCTAAPSARGERNSRCPGAVLGLSVSDSRDFRSTEPASGATTGLAFQRLQGQQGGLLYAQAPVKHTHPDYLLERN